MCFVLIRIRRIVVLCRFKLVCLEQKKNVLKVLFYVWFLCFMFVAHSVRIFVCIMSFVWVTFKTFKNCMRTLFKFPLFPNALVCLLLMLVLSFVAVNMKGAGWVGGGGGDSGLRGTIFYINTRQKKKISQNPKHIRFVGMVHQQFNTQ